METPTARNEIKVGPLTLALGLIALGGGLLAANLGFTGIIDVLKFWPLLLIGLGLEYFIRKFFSKEKELRFSILSTVLIATLALAASAANAVSNIAPGDFLRDQLFWDNAGYVRQWQGDPVPVSKGSRLEIENRLGEVEITASPDDRLHLSARLEGRGPTEDKAREAAEANAIHVETGPVTRVYTDPAPANRRSGVTIKLQVAVPAGLKISAVDKAGGITVKGLSAESLDIDTSSGGIDVNEFNGNFKARSNVGEISLSRLNGNADIEASNGRIAIQNPTGNIKAVNRNGEIELESDEPLGGKYTLQGDNGEIIIRLPQDSDLKIKASSKNGDITGLEKLTDQPGNKRGEVTLGKGTGLADLSTNNGHIDVSID